MLRIFIIVFGLIFIHELSAQEKFIARISNPEKGIYTELIKQNFDVLGFSPKEYIDVVVTGAEFQTLKNMGYSPIIFQTEAEVKNNLVVGKSLNGYRTYEDLLLELQQIEIANPGICKLYDIGETRGKEYLNGGNTNYSNYNHEVWALKVSDNVNVEEDEPCIFYFGVHHAREPISLEVNMYILNHILDNYGSDPDITNSVNNKQIWFIPLVNPNGHKIVTDELDVWQRKNIADNDSDGQIDLYHADGVDPNRNYGWQWGGGGSSGSTGSETYRGPTAFSEPEIQAIRDLMAGHHFVSGITYHSHGELVLYPYGYSSGASAPDAGALEELAVDMATNIPGLSGGNYTPQASWELYPADGVTDDYVYGHHGVFSFTIELATQFIPPASQVLEICQDNLSAALILLNRVDKSTLTGLVKDANTLNPVEAEIYVEGIDNTGSFREPYKSDTGFGRYYRLLQDGNLDVTFSAYGYIPQTFTNVNINSTGQTVLNVFLNPAQSVTVTGTITDFDTGLPIENATIEIMDSPVSPVFSNADGEYTIPAIFEGTYNFRIYAPGYATVIQENNISVPNTVFDFQLNESVAWSFESGSFDPNWVQGGNAPWTISTESPYDGFYCSKSGIIGNNSTSEMEITLTLSSGGDVSFFRKVSSEVSYDFLRFYIDGSLQDEWSGELGWEEVNFPVGSGEHTFTWVYYKDAYVIGGSDCAWVDYIIFPPIIPPLDPAEIDINPLSFTQSLPVNLSTDKQLSISNLGEQDLTFTATVEYLAGNKATASVYPLNANYNTGTTTSSSKTYTSLVRGYPPSEAGWMKFDVSSIPDGATINSIEFHGYVNANNHPWWNINPVSNDPLTATASALYTDIRAEASSGYYLRRDESGTLPSGWISHVLGGNANSNLQSALSQDWFAIGIMDRDNSTYFINFDGWNETNKPYLVIDYTYVPPYSWLTIDGLNFTGGTIQGNNQQDFLISFNSTGLSLGTYHATIKITSNDFDEPMVIIPCTFHVIEELSLDVSVFAEGPFNAVNLNTTLNSLELIPLTQPFNNDPWNYNGTESVGSMPNADVVDWVLIELRDATDAASATAATRISREAAFLLKDGSIVGLDGFSNLQVNGTILNDLFVLVFLRNHLGVISASGLPQLAGVYSYDFTTGMNQAHGGIDAQKEISTGIWGMISGDANGDGTISGLDLSESWENSAGLSGYEQGDLNLDGQVDNKDKDGFWFPNQGKGSYIPD